MHICGEFTLSFYVVFVFSTRTSTRIGMSDELEIQFGAFSSSSAKRFVFMVTCNELGWPNFYIYRLESKRTISKSVRRAGRVVGKQPPLSARGRLFWPWLLLSAKGNILVAIRSKISCFTCTLLTKLTTLRLVVRLPYDGTSRIFIV